MKNKLAMGFSFIVFGSVFLFGCSLQPLNDISYLEEPENESFLYEENDLLYTEEDLIVVGVSQLGSESDWRTINTKSIQEALTEENGYNLIFSNGRQRQENQIKAVRSFISQEVDYIVIAPVTETGWDTVLSEAKEADIPVILVDRTVDVEDESLYTTHIGSDLLQEGVKAGIWLEDYMEDMQESERAAMMEDGTLHIVILEGTVGSSAQIGRTDGFYSIAQEHDEWEILANDSGDFTKAKGKEVMEQYLAEFDDIDVLVSQNDDMTFGAIEAIENAGRTCGVDGDIIVISFDAVSEAFDLMEEGTINVDIECNPLQGELIAEVIQKLENGENVEKDIYIQEEIFESQNAAEERIGREY